VASWRRIASCSPRSSAPGLDAHLLDEQPPRVAERRERLGLTPAAVEGEHPLAAQVLAQRVAGDERLELGHEVGVTAEREIGVDAPLERHGALLLEACDLGLRKGLVRDVGQRRASPQGERLAQEAGRVRGPAARERVPTLAQEPLEAIDVELAVLDPQRVAAPVRLEPVPFAVAERAPQAADVVLQHLRRGRRGRLAPQRVDQAIARDRLVAMQEQQHQHNALPALAELDGAVLVGDLERSQQAKEHASTSGETVDERVAHMQTAPQFARMGAEWAAMGGR